MELEKKLEGIQEERIRKMEGQMAVMKKEVEGLRKKVRKSDIQELQISKPLLLIPGNRTTVFKVAFEDLKGVRLREEVKSDEDL